MLILTAAVKVYKSPPELNPLIIQYYACYEAYILSQLQQTIPDHVVTILQLLFNEQGIPRCLVMERMSGSRYMDLVK